MEGYHVIWEDVGFTGCNSPEEAVRIAIENIIMGNTTRFTVTDLKTGIKYIVDEGEVVQEIPKT